MEEDVKKALFQEEIPNDLFVTRNRVSVFDLETNITSEEVEEYTIPFNASESRWTTSTTKKVEGLLYQKLYEEDYVIWKPKYKGRYFSLLASKGGRRFLFVIALDSESEKDVSLALSLSSTFSVVIIRDKEKKEENNGYGVSVTSLLSPFNFLSL